MLMLRTGKAAAAAVSTADHGLYDPGVWHRRRRWRRFVISYFYVPAEAAATADPGRQSSPTGWIVSAPRHDSRRAAALVRRHTSSTFTFVLFQLLAGC